MVAQSQIAPVGAYPDAIANINQDWHPTTAGAVPDVAARMKLVLIIAGIPVTNNNAWANLIAQSNFEYPSGPVGNNLLGTSLQVNGSTSTNQDGVQSYKTWQDGVYAAAKMLQQSNDAPAYQSLFNNDPMTAAAGKPSYSTALAASSWEGNNPAAAAANASYGAAVAARYASLDANGTLKKLMSGAEAASPATLSPSGEAGAAQPGLNISDPVTAFLSDIIGGFGIGWKAVLTIIGGILLVGVGLLVMFHKQTGRAAEAAVALA